MKHPALACLLARRRRPALTALGALSALVALCGTALANSGATPAAGATLPADAVAAQVQRLAQEAAAQAWGTAAQPPRIEVTVGTLDARLRLAPCEHIEPYLPKGSRPIGRTRIGLRCTQGPTPWNVYLPIVVKVYGRSLVAIGALPTGTVLEARHLLEAEVDIAAQNDPVVAEPGLAIGRTLAQGLADGQALRRGNLRTRQWFNAGDTVRIVAIGPGYSVSSEGQALGAGLEGQPARVRTESGRIVQGLASGHKRVELTL